MAADLSTIANLAQKYLADVSAVILGSGASVPHGLPTMKDLTAHLEGAVHPVTVTDEASWGAVRTLLAGHTDLEGALNQTNPSLELRAMIISATWEFMTAADLKLRLSLLAGGEKMPLSHLFEYLLRTSRQHISVVTTNYDRVAEYAAGLASFPVYRGFQTGAIVEVIEEPVRSLVAGPASKRQHIDIWKVHGSLDWFRLRDGRVYSCDLHALPPPGIEPLIVAPGTWKYRATHQEPFRACMTSADRVVTDARAYLCVGYGFNDDHVQAKLLAAVKRGKPIVVLAQELTSNARRALLDAPPREFLALEQSDGQTRVYHPSAPHGELLAEPDLWSLKPFIDRFLSSEVT